MHILPHGRFVKSPYSFIPSNRSENTLKVNLSLSFTDLITSFLETVHEQIFR